MKSGWAADGGPARAVVLSVMIAAFLVGVPVPAGQAIGSATAMPFPGGRRRRLGIHGAYR
jgi:cytosine/uracil/thiamine/allantoin permease